MREVFLCGPWALAPIRDRLGLSDVVRAQLPGGTLVTQESAIFPFMTLAGSGAVMGVLGTADTAAWECITYLAEVLEWSIVPRCIDGRMVQAVLPPECDDTEGKWHAEAWAARWGAIVVEAANEILELRDKRSAGAVRGLMHMVYARASSRVAAAYSVPAEIRAATGIDTVEQLDQETSHAGFFLTRTYELRHPSGDGGISPRLRREVFVATDAAIVLPYDPVRDRVLLVEQFRMGPYGRGDIRPWTLEPVAGRVDAGEDPSQTARRECEEEAGLDLRDLEHISSHYCTPGCSTEYFHIYLGLCDLPEVRKGHGGLDSENEDIRTHVIDFEAAMRLLQSGEADNGPLVLSLLWLQRERSRLRASA